MSDQDVPEINLGKHSRRPLGHAAGRKILALSFTGPNPSGQPGAPGEDTSRIYRLDKDRIVIGSVESADVRLVGAGVSPIHAVIEVGTQPVIYDLASTTGVLVNDAKVVTQALKNGDRIAIGPNRLVFQLEDLAAVPMGELGSNRVLDAGGHKLFLNPKEDLSALLLEDERSVREIFDYRPASKQALEIIMSWHGTILDVEHFVDTATVTIGGGESDDFGIPALLAAKHYPIVTQQGQGYVLNLDPKMSGVVQREGRLQPLETLRAEPGAKAGPHGPQVPLRREDFAKVTLGEIDFYLSYTAAPPRLKPSQLIERDPLFLKVILSSLLLTVVTVTGLLSVDVPKDLEAEHVPERIATILYQPEKYSQKPVRKEAPTETQPPKAVAPKEPKRVQVEIKPTPRLTPKPVPKEMSVTKKQSDKPVASRGGGQAKKQNMAKEGKGARAKGKEGARGSKTAAPGKEKQTSATRASPQGGSGRAGGQSQVQDEGNLDILKGATGKIQDLLGNTAANLGKGGEKVKGFGGFSTAGDGGLALQGSGKGGGGDADTSLGGLADSGRGGGRVGTGKGAAGTGNGIIGGKSRVVLRTGGPEEAVVLGSIDPDAIRDAILAHKDEFRLCYEREMNAPGAVAKQKLSGTVAPTFIIGPSGKITKSAIIAEATTLNDANIQRCVLAVLGRINFPIPRGAGEVEVKSFPFKYAPGGG
jgi:hypothetical protein